MKWVKGRAPPELNYKLPTKKNEYTCGKNIIGILFWKSPKDTDELITNIIDNQLDIKLGQFTQEELDLVLAKIKNRKAADLDEIPPEVWKTGRPTAPIVPCRI